MKIIRVFPRKTKATPADAFTFYGPPPFYAEADRILISVTFTYDKNYSEYLGEQWKHICPVEISGPAYGIESGEFIPGKFLKHGYTITSRGCPNKCFFCEAWKREKFKELEIKPGSNLLDDNILACSDNHIKKVFQMLEQQPRVQFTGGLEAARLKNWHIEYLKKIKPRQMFFANDTPADFEPLIEAGKKLKAANFPVDSLRCYVLIGHKNDTFKKAEKRLIQTYRAGFIPMAMVYINKAGEIDPKWQQFKTEWIRPPVIKHKMKGIKPCS